jgi:hypothetical protein
MANRNFYSNSHALEVDNVSLWCEVNIGAAGAVSSSSGLGIASVTKESADGKYTIRLSDSYNKLLHANVMVLDDTNSDPTTVAIAGRIFSEDVDHATAPNIVIQGIALDDGAAANFASGAKLLVKIELRNSSVTNT